MSGFPARVRFRVSSRLPRARLGGSARPQVWLPTRWPCGRDGPVRRASGLRVCARFPTTGHTFANASRVREGGACCLWGAHACLSAQTSPFIQDVRKPPHLSPRELREAVPRPPGDGVVRPAQGRPCPHPPAPAPGRGPSTRSAPRRAHGTSRPRRLWPTVSHTVPFCILRVPTSRHPVSGGPRASGVVSGGVLRARRGPLAGAPERRAGHARPSRRSVRVPRPPSPFASPHLPALINQFFKIRVSCSFGSCMP